MGEIILGTVHVFDSSSLTSIGYRSVIPHMCINSEVKVAHIFFVYRLDFDENILLNASEKSENEEICPS